MESRGSLGPGRLGVVLLLAGLMSVLVVMSAAVRDRQSRPALAAAIWPSHPDVATDKALLEIATAAAGRRDVSAATRREVDEIARRAPWSPEPYVIAGAIAATKGEGDLSEQLLLAARLRDPASRSARFLLADRFLRTGRIAEGLIEMNALVNLQAQGAEVFAPALVSFARQPGAVPQLRKLFARNPRTEAGVLSVLAADAANADLVLALATSRQRLEPDWRGTLLGALVRSGQYDKARDTWLRLSGIQSAPILFNPGFASRDAPPPFNWQFPTGSEGIAEPDGKGGLDVLYYGRANTTLAMQLMLLPVGQYRLSAAVTGAGGENAIHWAVRCDRSSKLIADARLQPRTTTTFAVPVGCEAQWIELRGVATESPTTVEATISDLRLTRGNP